MVLYLVSIGMVGAVTATAFALASLPLLHSNNRTPNGSNFGYQGSEFKSISSDDVPPNTERNTRPAATQRTATSDAAATLPKPRIQASAFHTSLRSKVNRPGADNDLLSSDREGIPTPEVLASAAAPGSAPDGTRTPEITRVERAAGSASSTGKGAGTNDPASAGPVPSPVIRDEERNQVFRDFEIQHNQNVRHITRARLAPDRKLSTPPRWAPRRHYWPSMRAGADRGEAARLMQAELRQMGVIPPRRHK